ncbi:MAG: hypothetical protein FJX55_12380 [Alphaproteobacteria bacterium]|nr:hypothetical protein [Alphaproteobacteria bacterium]
MKALPKDFADLLSARGRRILEGRDRGVRGAIADPRRPFLALDGALDRDKAAAVWRLLDRALGPHLVKLSQPVPPESISGQTRKYQERLRKTVRNRTAYLERRDSRAWRAAEEIGLIAMTASDSYRRFVEIVAGRPLARKFGRQLLCYGPGDYAGPHTDHHPEDPRAASGYIDFHLSFAGPGVQRQLLVYARDGHFTEEADVATAGGISAYRLPFWHFTTPLKARPGQEATARRWVVLGTFLFDEGPCR